MDQAPRAPIDDLMDWLAADPTFVEKPGDPDEVTITFMRGVGRRGDHASRARCDSHPDGSA
jgi:hypothetical protein